MGLHQVPTIVYASGAARYIPLARIHVDFVVRTCRKSGRLERVCRMSLNNRGEAGCTRAPMYTETVKRGN